MNPVEQVVTLAKKGDRRVLLGGAALIGGGIGLFVFLHNRHGGVSVMPLPNKAETSGMGGEGGGGGGGGSSDLSGLSTSDSTGIPEFKPADSVLAGTTAPSNLAETQPIAASDLPQITAAPSYAGAVPTFDSAGFTPSFEAASPAFSPLTAPETYTGGNYGGLSAASPTVAASVGGGVSAIRQPSSFDISNAPLTRLQGSLSGAITPETKAQSVLSKTQPTQFYGALQQASPQYQQVQSALSNVQPTQFYSALQAASKTPQQLLNITPQQQVNLFYEQQQALFRQSQQQESARIMQDFYNRQAQQVALSRQQEVNRQAQLQQQQYSAQQLTSAPRYTPNQFYPALQAASPQYQQVSTALRNVQPTQFYGVLQQAGQAPNQYSQAPVSRDTSYLSQLSTIGRHAKGRGARE